MFQPDDPSAVPLMPAPSAAGTPGWFGPGDPATGELPTLLSADFMNGVLAELLAVLAAAGIQPNKAQTTQLLTAIQAIVRQVGDARYLTSAGASFVTPQQLAAAIAGLIGNPSAPLQTLLAIDQEIANNEGVAAALASLVASKVNRSGDSMGPLTVASLTSTGNISTAGGEVQLEAGGGNGGYVGIFASDGVTRTMYAGFPDGSYNHVVGENGHGFAFQVGGIDVLHVDTDGFVRGEQPLPAGASDQRLARTDWATAEDAGVLSQAESYANGVGGNALSQANSTAAAGDAATLAAAEAFAAGQATAAIAAAGGYDVLCDDRPAGKNLFHYILQWPTGKYSEIIVVSGVSWGGSQINYYLYAGGSVNEIRICGTDGTLNVKQMFIAGANTSNPLIQLLSYGGSSGGFTTLENNYVPGYPTYGGPNQYAFPAALSGFSVDIDIQANPGATFNAGRLLVLGRRAS